MYTKPYLDVEKQVELLQTRGLVFGDKKLAQNILSSINYYRFTGYDKPFIAIAQRYKIKGNILESYIHHISVVRNMCAHHTRLWDRTFYGLRPLNHWHQTDLTKADTRRLFYTLLLVYRLTQHLPCACFDRLAWKDNLIKRLQDFQALPNCSPFYIMGIPPNGLSTEWWV